jgi:hypothetical protein
MRNIWEVIKKYWYWTEIISHKTLINWNSSQMLWKIQLVDAVGIFEME